MADEISDPIARVDELVAQLEPILPHLAVADREPLIEALNERRRAIERLRDSDRELIPQLELFIASMDPR